MWAKLQGKDTKMMHKNIQPYADALIELNHSKMRVVSSFLNTTCFLTCKQILLRIGLNVTWLMTVWCQSGGLASGLLHPEINLCTLTSSRGMCLSTCWDYGPFLPGDDNNNMIFHQGLAHELGLNERLKTDKGYVGSPPFGLGYLLVWRTQKEVKWQQEQG